MISASNFITSVHGWYYSNLVSKSLVGLMNGLISKNLTCNQHHMFSKKMLKNLLTKRISFYTYICSNTAEWRNEKKKLKIKISIIQIRFIRIMRNCVLEHSERSKKESYRCENMH